MGSDLSKTLKRLPNIATEARFHLLNVYFFRQSSCSWFAGDVVRSDTRPAHLPPHNPSVEGRPHNHHSAVCRRLHVGRHLASKIVVNLLYVRYNR